MPDIPDDSRNSGVKHNLINTLQPPKSKKNQSINDE